MNEPSASVKQFCDVRARDARGRATIVFVPGYEGREYFVFIHRNNTLVIHCNEPGVWGNRGCEDNSGDHICCHAMVALEVAAEDQGMTLSWCENEAAAEELAQTGGNVFHARNRQGTGEAWGVVVEDGEKNVPVDTLLDKATRYVRLHQRWLVDPPQLLGDEEWKALREYFAVKHWTYSTIEKYRQENDPEAVLARGRALLHGEDVKEI